MSGELLQESSPTTLQPTAAAWERLIRRSKLISIGGNAQVKIPAPRPGMSLLWVDGNGKDYRIIPDPLAAQQPWALHVRTEPWNATVTVSKVGHDQGHDWDLTLATTWKIGNPHKFAEVYALPHLTCDSSLSTAELQHWLLGRIEHLMRKELTAYTVQQLRDGALPAQAWQGRMQDWADPYQLHISVTDQQLYSASAAAAALRQEQDQLAESLRKERQKQLDRELEDHRQQSLYQEQKQQITHSQQLSAAQREQQLAELDREQQKRQDQLEQDRIVAAEAIDLIRKQNQIQLNALQQRVNDERMQQQRQMQAQFQQKRDLAGIDAARQLNQLETEKEQLRNQVKIGQVELAKRTAELERLQEQAREEAVRRETEFSLRIKESELRIKQLAANDATEWLRQQHESQLAVFQQHEREMQAEFQEKRESAMIEAARQMNQLEAEKEQLRNHVKISQIDLAKRAAELEQLQEQARKAAEQRDAEFAQRMKESELRIKQLETQVEKTVARPESAGQTIQTMMKEISPLIKDLLGNDYLKSHQAAERLMNEYGTNLETMQGFGINMTTQSLVDQWASKAERDAHAVRLGKYDFVTRDLCVKLTDSLKIGSSLAFTLTSQRAGYTTLINLGTSGKFWRLTPGAYCPIEQSRIVAGSTHQVPGSELFPLPPQSLTENGPKGWEHIVAIVSDEPLFSQATCMMASDPIVEISRPAMQSLHEKLQATPNSWSAAVLSFLVVDTHGI